MEQREIYLKFILRTIYIDLICFTIRDNNFIQNKRGKYAGKGWYKDEYLQISVLILKKQTMNSKWITNKGTQIQFISNHKWGARKALSIDMIYFL